MANKDKAMTEQDGLERHREITNTGGRLDREDGGEEEPRPARAGEHDGGEGPEKAGRKTGDDDWHNRVNRRSEKGEGADPMYGGNVRR